MNDSYGMHSLCVSESAKAWLRNKNQPILTSSSIESLITKETSSTVDYKSLLQRTLNTYVESCNVAREDAQDRQIIKELETLIEATFVHYISCLSGRRTNQWYDTVDQLLTQYPEFVMQPSAVSSGGLWHDVKKNQQLLLKTISNDSGDMNKSRNKRGRRRRNKVLSISSFSSTSSAASEPSHSSTAAAAPPATTPLLTYDVELQRLLMFRNYLATALQIIPATKNKHTLIRVAALLEGSGQEYKLGGEPRPATLRRVLIYEREGQVVPKIKRTLSDASLKPSVSDSKSTMGVSTRSRDSTKRVRSSNASNTVAETQVQPTVSSLSASSSSSSASSSSSSMLSAKYAATKSMSASVPTTASRKKKLKGFGLIDKALGYATGSSSSSSSPSADSLPVAEEDSSVDRTMEDRKRIRVHIQTTGGSRSDALSSSAQSASADSTAFTPTSSGTVVEEPSYSGAVVAVLSGVDASEFVSVMHSSEDSHGSSSGGSPV